MSKIQLTKEVITLMNNFKHCKIQFCANQIYSIVSLCFFVLYIKSKVSELQDYWTEQNPQAFSPNRVVKAGPFFFLGKQSQSPLLSECALIDWDRPQLSASHRTHAFSVDPFVSLDCFQHLSMSPVISLSVLYLVFFAVFLEDVNKYTSAFNYWDFFNNLYNFASMRNITFHKS